MEKQPLIVGIDPGSTSAVAAVTLDGEIELLESGKNFPPREIIQRIIKVGKPVVTASDKKKTPSKVQKISTSLGTHLFEPREDLSQKKKKQLGKGANSHEIDAVASAAHAQKQLHKQIQKIKKAKKETPHSEAEIAEKILNKKPLTSLENKKHKPKTNNEHSKHDNQSQKTSDTDPEKQRMERKIQNLEDQVQKLRSELGEEKKQKQKLQSKINKLHSKERREIRKEEIVEKRETEIKNKQKKINHLKEEVENLKLREQKYTKAVQKLFNEDHELVPVVNEEIETVPEKAVTRNQELIELLEQKGCKIYPIEEVKGMKISNFYVIEELPEPKNFESIIQEYRDKR